MTLTILAALTEVAMPALRKVLPRDAISRVELSHCENPYSGRRARDAIRIDVEVGEDHFSQVIYAPEVFHSIEDSRDRLASDLADWAAESTFGWGEKRE